tara:strand:+ start:2798 stop:3118 length:321 start_codon:yes stop_codon:yes gene_type:complete
MNQEQNHPLYLLDRDHLNRLLAKVTPGDEDLIDLARLIIRYKDFPGAHDLQADMNKILNLWGLTNESLNFKTRQIWENGYRPGNNIDESIGSGFDTSDSTSNNLTS